MAKRCQSCGMPLKKDPQGGGTETDGRRSQEYCSFCYADGAFTTPDFTATQMQDFCIVQMNKQGVPRWLAWVLTRDIPRLGRWAERG